jgi:hypothetical protein
LGAGSNTAQYWNVTGIPVWMTHNGTGLLSGTVPAFNDNPVLDTISLNATVSNPYGSSNASITFSVLEDSTGTVNNAYYSFDGNNDYARTDTSSSSNNPMYRNGGNNGYAWAFSVTFDDVDNPTGSSRKPIMAMGGASTGVVLERKQSNLRLRFGRMDESNNNLHFTATSFFSTGNNTLNFGETKVSVIVTYDGRSTGTSSSSINNYYDAFRIYVVEEDETITRIDNVGTWTNDDFGYTGGLIGWTYFGNRLGTGDYSATRLYGAAIMTCRQGGGGSGIQELSTDAERIMFALNYSNYISTYQTGRTFRQAGATSTLSSWNPSTESHARSARFYEFFTNTSQDVFPYVQNIGYPSSTNASTRVQVFNGTSSQIGND